MFSKDALLNEYHKLQQAQDQLDRTPDPDAHPPQRSSLLALVSSLADLDPANLPPALKTALTNPIALVAGAVVLWILIGLVTKLLFVAGIAAAAYFLLKGTGSTGGPLEDVQGLRPHHRPDNMSGSPYPAEPSPSSSSSPYSSNPSSQPPKDLGSFLWQKGMSNFFPPPCPPSVRTVVS
ncbi:hypothetical protein JCM10212_003818 [Sporobolomyces blumeae]